MDYGVLGPLRVVDDGREVEIPGRKERALLGLLVVEAGTVVSTDRLIFELWGDSPPADAPAALRTHVSRLRKSLGVSHQIATQRPGYRLEADLASVDVARFEQLADEAGEHRHRAELAAGRARTALGEWRGPALGDLIEFEYAVTEARRLDQRRLATLEIAIEAEMNMGQHAALIPELNLLTSQHPYNETFWSFLMLALYRSSRAGEALETFRRAETALGESLGIGPSASLRSLERAIVMEDEALGFAPISTPNNLPSLMTTFVGRENEMKRLTEVLDTTRILTMTGAGGSGKSRLATELAAKELANFPDGVWKVEMAPVRGPEAVAPTVASVLGEPASHSADPADSLADYLADRRVLLLIDNCEHLLEPIGDLVKRLVSRCPNLTVLNTSREALHIPEETIWLVNPLQLPRPDSTTTELEKAEAFRLFVDRAKAANPAFTVEDDNRHQIAELCLALAGLPLAIELAAARSAAFSPAQLLRRVSAGIEVLDRGGTVTLDRNRTMQGSLEWSFRLLGERLSRVFTRLAVFRGGFTLEDAAYVAGERGEDTADDVASLVDKSLVARDMTLPERHQMLEPVREYARVLFQAGTEADEIRSRHAARFLAVGRAADRHLRGPEQQVWLDRLEADHGNLRKAIEWAIGTGAIETALELVAACGWFWFMNGHWRESWEWLSRVLHATGDEAPMSRAHAIYKTGALQVIRLNVGPVMPLVEQALEICRKAGDRYGEAWCLHLIGHGALYGYDADPELMVGAREIFAALDRPWEVAWSDRYIGDVKGMTGEAELGVELQLRSVSAFRELGDRWSTAYGLYNVASLLANLPAYGPRAAEPYFERALRLADDIGDKVWSAHALRGLAGCAVLRGADNAEDLLMGVIDRMRLMGDEACLSTALGYLGDVRHTQGRVAEAVENVAEALRLRHKLGNEFGVSHNLQRLALLALDTDHAGAASRLMAVVAPIAARWGDMMPRLYHDQHRRLLGLLGTTDTEETIETVVPWALELAEMMIHEQSASPVRVTSAPRSFRTPR